MNSVFTKSTPEAQGVSSYSIINFIKAAKQKNIPLHSFLLFKNNKLLFEGYYAPFTKTVPHRMFSISKTFTSAAIGILSAMSKIDLSAPVIDYFPSYDSLCTDPIIRSATVKDLLSMRSPHKRTAFKQLSNKDYVKSFFTLPSTKFPNLAFCYDSSASHLLGVLTENITNMSLTDFLKENIPCLSQNMYSVKDPMGHDTGDSGFMATPTDAAILAHLFLNKGKLPNSDRQIISKEYAENAVSKITDTSIMANCPCETYGYGLGIWKTKHNGFMAYGIGGQLAAAYPDKNIVFVTTADIFGIPGGTDIIFDLFYHYIYDTASALPLPPSPDANNELSGITQGLSLPVLSKTEPPKELVNKTFMLPPNKYNINNVKIVKSNTYKLTFIWNKGNFELPFDFGKNAPSFFPYYNCKCLTSASAPSTSSIIIKTLITDEEIGSITFFIEFKNNTGAFVIRKTLPSGFEEFELNTMLTL